MQKIKRRNVLTNTRINFNQIETSSLLRGRVKVLVTTGDVGGGGGGGVVNRKDPI